MYVEHISGSGVELFEAVCAADREGIVAKGQTGCIYPRNRPGRRSPETGKFGFSVWMLGKRPHYEMAVFDGPEGARGWLDPQNEREWAELDPPGDGIVLISRGYREDSVPARLAHA
jgi:hypothetical protein